MGFTKVEDLSTDVVHKLGGINTKTGKDNPGRIDGYYLGSRTVESNTGTSTIHVFQTPKGNEGVWGTADINTKLGSVKLGTMTKVVYKEKRKLAGGKTKHVYDVMVDKDNMIEVAGALALETSEDESYEEDPMQTEEDTEAEDVEDEAQVELAAQAAARKAKVNALLTKKR